MIAERNVDGQCHLCLQGALTIDEVTAVLAEADHRVRAADCTLDLAEVTTLDSAAVSLVLALLRASQASGRRLSLINAPASFSSLASLYGVDSLLVESLTTHVQH
ncbi:STAS domain-containing protein [Viridibacterium curvum]|uniref:STAS domain-containing protein n=1 Tax=Viridibacterium curvum TaxID=1101404 RepID=A0ABP9Q8F7_9RHOO